MGSRRQHEFYELSFAQDNVLALEKACPGSSINNICLVIRICGCFNASLLSTCLNKLLQRDDTLRLQVTELSGKTMQYIREYTPQEFLYYDFTLPGSESVDRWAESFAVVPIWRLDAPLYEFNLFKSGENTGGLLLKLSHFITDGYSLIDIVNYIYETYSKLLANEKLLDETTRPSYIEHINAEKEYKASSDYQEDLEYWRELLTDCPGTLLFGHLRHPVAAYTGNRISFRLSRLLSNRIKSYCLKNRVAPFSLYYMALNACLCRMSGTNSMNIGVPVLNRSNFSDKQTGGMFVSTLPFIQAFDDSLSLNEYNEVVNEAWYNLLRHSRFPFSEINALYKNLQPTGGRLFDAVLSFQDCEVFSHSNNMTSFSGKWLYAGQQAEQLIIHFNRLNDNFFVDYDYLIQFYSEDTVARLHKYVTRLLSQMLNDPNCPIWRFHLINEDEREALLYTNNMPKVERELKTVPEKFLAESELHPERCALIFQGIRMTYSSLERYAASFSNAIDATGKESPTVAICLPRGFALIAAMLGIAGSGGAWVVIPPDLPQIRIEEILAESGAEIVVTNGACRGMFENLPQLCLLSENVNSEGEWRKITAQTTAPAYMISTSGSTGRPKCTVVPHKAIVNFAYAMEPYYPHGAVLSICNTGFDAFLLETIAALLCGRTVVIATEKECNNPEALAGLIRNYGVSFLATTPSRLNAFLRNESFADAISNFESIVCGGEALSGELVQKVKNLTSARIYNQYGPSETAIGVSIKEVNHSEEITIGNAMQNCRLYILDTHNLPVPIGGVGELWIGGDCVGLGYQGQDELNARSFAESPFEIGERIYRSGDKAYITESGEIALVGRLDDQVQLHGLRIDLNEISSRLASYPGINAAAVKLIEGENSWLAAYYTAEQAVNEEDLMAYLAARLPLYMLPAAFQQLAALPLNANGKIDLKALPIPEVTKRYSGLAGMNAEPVLAIFRSVLQKDDLQAEDDFFTSGGDSLGAMMVVSDIADQFGIEIKPTDIYAFRSAAALTGHLATYKPELAGDGVLPASTSDLIRPVEREHYPLTPTQHAIYLKCILEPCSTAYNMPAAFKLVGIAPDSASLESAFHELIIQENILRTAFVSEGTEVYQIISPNPDFSFESLSTDDFSQAAASFVRPFDLAQAPLLRAAIWQDPAGESFLFLDMHHIIGDGLTTPLLLERLAAILAGNLSNRQEVSFKDYAVWLSEQKIDSAVEYWTEKLNGFNKALPLPYDFEPELMKDSAAGRIVLTSGAELHDKIAVFCKERSLTPGAFFAAALGILLAKLTGATDLCLAMPVSLRQSRQTQQIAGPFINTLPLRLQAPPESSLGSYLQMVSTSMAELTSHAAVDASAIPGWANLTLPPGTALYDVLLSMRPFEAANLALADCDLIYLPLPPGAPKFPLAVEISQNSLEYSLCFEYDTALFRTCTIEFYGRSLLTIAADMLKQATDTSWLNIEVLSPIDKYKLFQRPATLRLPFEDELLDVSADRWAQLDSDRPAIIFHDQVMSYAQFKATSDAAAQNLLKCGITPGSTIAVCCRRGFGFITAVFAVLKAGCAYLPLTDALPVGRINSMLDQACVKYAFCDQAGRQILENCARAELILFDIADETSSAISFAPLGARVTSDAAQVLFTSGSSGAPKGIVIPHRPIANLAAYLSGIYEQAGAERFLCSSSILFDSYTTDVLVPLTLGKTVIVADEEEMVSPWSLAQLIEKHHVDLIFSTPSRMKVYLADASFSASLARLKLIMSGGEVMSEQLAEQLCQACGGAVYNLYGPAETTAFVTACRVDGKTKPTIGKAIPNTRVYILDEKGERCLPTVSGEIYISGESLSDGYIGQPDLTAKAFLPDPFYAASRMYRSGDLARLLADGNFEYLGRCDSQVKLDGRRIETAEISDVIMKSNLVKDAVAFIEASSLYAAVVPKVNYCEDELRDLLAKALPDYMHPAGIFVLDDLPYTATGKADVRTLIKLCDISTQSANNTATTITSKQPDDLESAVLQLWSEALKKPVDPEKSFFAQGGSSLAAMSVIVGYMNQGWDFSLTDFYRYPLLADQLSLLKRQYEPVQSVRSVLLTGATGFLGAHLLNELLLSGFAPVYCLVRGGQERLSKRLEYYFGQEWLNWNANQIKVLEGDLVQSDLGLSKSSLTGLKGRVEYVINAAADVRHFAECGALDAVNISGVANTMSLTADIGAQFIQISTISLNTEQSIFSEFERASATDEENIYIRSKRLAEELVFANEQPTKIFRVGLLTGRSTDGKFQINSAQNSFYLLLRSLFKLGYLPESAANMQVCLTPVDLCAKAIVALLDGERQVYHITSPQPHKLSEILPELGFSCLTISDAEFNKLMQKPGRDPAFALLGTVLNAKHHAAPVISSQASQAELAAKGFVWSPIDIRMTLQSFTAEFDTKETEV